MKDHYWVRNLLNKLKVNFKPRIKCGATTGYAKTIQYIVPKKENLSANKAEKD